jgi:hypothetical protein
VNTTGFQPIHETNLQKGETYYLKTKWGEALVKVVEVVPEGWDVEILDGGFKPPLKRYGKGDQMLAGNGAGQWYELKG